MPIESRYTRLRMEELSGISASPGIALGKAFLFLEDKLKVPKYDVPPVQASFEGERFLSAVRAARGQVETLANGRENPLLEAQLLMFDDPDFHDKVLVGLEESGKNAEWVLLRTMEELSSKLEESPSQYMRERAVDLRDVGMRIMDRLLHRERTRLSSITEPVILVAHNLMPSDALALDRRLVLGLATDVGGKTSHTAILARALEIPAVLGLSDVSRRVKPGDHMVVDGERGVVIVSPDDATISLYRSRKGEREKRLEVLRELVDLPAETRDGKLVRLEANIEVPEESEIALAHGADGIGLFRSEFLFLQPGRVPSEEDQYRAYCAVLEAMGQRSVTIRTLDLGGDKVTPGMFLEAEANPILGWRAVRFCLSRPEIFKTQLRALLRASVHGNLRIMFPLISGAGELDRISSLMEEAKAELTAQGIPFSPTVPTGIMIEVPSAAVTSDILAGRADFFSIGTNDLIQYTLAVDRGNERVAYLYEPFHPGVLRLIKMTIDNAHARGIPVGMCGEMAGDPLAAVVLLGLGLDSLSMGAIGIPPIKRIIRSVGAMEVEAFVRSLLPMQSGQEIESAVRGWMGERFEPVA
jgi:phosphoenolpyruvate-protein phosphotransferase (PTS system enzyme I)